MVEFRPAPYQDLYEWMNPQTSQTAQNSTVELDAVGTLLRDLIDYAGLFPPASLAMAPSVANYEAYSRSEWNWILGRFIVPIARLVEFEKAFKETLAASRTPTHDAVTNWRVSVLLGSDPTADIASVREFNGRMASANFRTKAIIEAV